MVWLGARRGHAFDWATQRWVQLTGRRLHLDEAPWLSGPTASTRGVGGDFFERWGQAHGLSVLPHSHDSGLIDGLEALAGPTFAPGNVHQRIRDFYAHTAAFDLEIRSHWSGVFRALGWLMSRMFARRLAQLNMPVSDRELRGGVESRIVRLADPEGRVRHTAWVRTAVETGLPVFVGQYGTATIDPERGPLIKVVFPLPNGNAIILLRPQVLPNGGFSLVSDGKRFGDPGFYFTVVDGESGQLWARYVRTMKEELTLQVDHEADLIRARHRFRVFGLSFLELEYRIEHRGATASPVNQNGLLGG